MKSTQRPSKPPKQQPKSNNPKPDLVAYKPAEQSPVTSEPDFTSSNEPLQTELQAITDDKPLQVEAQIEQQAMPLAKFSINADDQPLQVGLRAIADEKPLPSGKGKAYPRARKSDSPPQHKQRQFEPREEEELPPENCQHMQFMDCDKPVGRVVFECWHCQQGIISEFTGEPVIGEYKGRPSVVLAKVQCPSCGETAIRLSALEVLSTTAIASPWK
ncbi:MAG: hypothetical protein KME40_30045 [Komarekiella atlantica HA4396-MV6]|jgi:hypothetical protein|nr:hypothetical protein [Komarekiella atlantica HA4396-MV6]